ncbi:MULTISPECIES: hypothetical protein [unclassified Sphingomonas]|jgi:hypothetical protein|nr:MULTISPECIES: hypothetical protein [unclassified Sphingomonas]
MIGSLLATGCTSAEVNGLNSKDNLHCAAVLGVAGQNAERGNAPAERRRALFVGNSWYSQRVAREALETPEASQAAARARQGGAGIERLATACLDRASRHPAFAGFSRRIGAVYDEAAAAHRR